MDLHAKAINMALERLVIQRSDLNQDFGESRSPEILEKCSPMSICHVHYLAKKLCEVACGDVYFADGRPYTIESLNYEFPELKVFNITIAEAFEMKTIPKIWLETKKFSNLRSLSRMRREIRRTGTTNGIAAAELIQVLLGL